MQVDDRAVGDVDDCQRRTAGLDEQHRDVLVVERGADGLCEGGRSEQRRDQHDASDVAGGKLVTQCTSAAGVDPRHPGRCQPVAAFGRALPGADNGRNRLGGRRRIHRVLRHGDLEALFLDGGTVSVFAFDQHQADRRGLH